MIGSCFRSKNGNAFAELARTRLGFWEFQTPVNDKETIMAQRNETATKQRPASNNFGSRIEPAVSSPAPKFERVPTEDEVRVLAYRKWLTAGMPSGDGVNFWLEAERELSQAAWPPPY
jgi:DUF2934 family protein